MRQTDPTRFFLVVILLTLSFHHPPSTAVAAPGSEMTSLDVMPRGPPAAAIRIIPGLIPNLSPGLWLLTVFTSSCPLLLLRKATPICSARWIFTFSHFSSAATTACWCAGGPQSVESSPNMSVPKRGRRVPGEGEARCGPSTACLGLNKAEERRAV